MAEGIWIHGNHILGEDIAAACRGLNLLYMYSAPSCPDGVETVCSMLESQATMFDLRQQDRADLADSHTWHSIESQLKEGQYHAILTSPPCETFSRARCQSGP